MIALTPGQIALVYLIPAGFIGAVMVGTAAIVYLLARSRLDFAFKHDLLRKFEAKRTLPSGRSRLSFLYVCKLLFGDSCIQAAFLFRISRFLASRGLRTLAEIVHSFSRFATHADISPLASIGPGFYLYHGLGTIIGKNSRIGRGALICQGVSIGGGVVLGDDVKVWAGAQILRNVTIGDRTEIGANAVVMNDFPSDSIVFGVPARLAGKKPAEGTEAAPQPSGGVT
jgi:serine O-acetyltransferase